MKSINILFNVPYVGIKEAEAAYNAVRFSSIVGNGTFGKKAECILGEIFDVKHALLTTSCTHALELALMSIGVGVGDEVICPSFTFVSTANAVVRQRAKPVFAEIDDETLNIDVKDVARRITNKTKAIIPVHYAGVSCDMNGIMKLAEDNNLAVIEDAAHGICAKYRNRYLGTIGDIGCFSFHATKNITSGEGGALLTSNEVYYKNAEIGREKGTNRSAYLKGVVNKYSWVDEGSSFVMSDVLSSILIEQLDKMDEIISKRRKIFYDYLNGFRNLEYKGLIRLPKIDEDREVNGHIFYLRLRTERERDNCIRKLRKRGIEATFHFVPLHTSPYGKGMLGYKKGDFPVTEEVSRTILRLPIYPQLTTNEVDFIIENVAGVLTHGGDGA